MQFNIHLLKFISIYFLIETCFSKNLNHLKNNIENKSTNEIQLFKNIKNNTNSNRQSAIQGKLSDLKKNLIDSDFSKKFSCFHVTPEFSAYDLFSLDKAQ